MKAASGGVPKNVPAERRTAPRLHLRAGPEIFRPGLPLGSQSPSRILLFVIWISASFHLSTMEPLPLSKHDFDLR